MGTTNLVQQVQLQNLILNSKTLKPVIQDVLHLHKHIYCGEIFTIMLPSVKTDTRTVHSKFRNISINCQIHSV